MFSLRPSALAAMVAFLALFDAVSARAQTPGCEAPDWSPTVTYLRGDRVMHIAYEWTTKRNSQNVGTVSPNTCEDGMGVAARVFDIPIPMEQLRQD